MPAVAIQSLLTVAQTSYPPPWNIVAHYAYMFHPMVVLNGTGTITYTALLTLLQYNEQESYEGSEQPERLQTCCVGLYI